MTNEAAQPKTLREIKSGKVLLTPIDAKKIAADPVGWLRSQAKPGMLLLAHADDGVIWGKVISTHDGSLDFEVAKDQAKLRGQTLLMARLFDNKRECFLWRVDEATWCARLLEDEIGEASDYFDEAQILWGDTVEDQDDDFVFLTEGAQGLRHSPPKEMITGDLQEHKAQLMVRHYLQVDDGWPRVVVSRLMINQWLANGLIKVDAMEVQA